MIMGERPRSSGPSVSAMTATNGSSSDERGRRAYKWLSYLKDSWIFVR